jgi:crotonobetainyl-CoA:carnitine CoA-transferase CaiB-like acyl-CoA transferase
LKHVFDDGFWWAERVPMTGDLADITVVAVEQAVAAPYASSRLADAGARVIKVERAEGDFARNYDRSVHGQSAYFLWLNRGKESVCIDLKKTSDLDLLHALLSRADVFIHNLKPNLLAGLGFEAAALRVRYPRLVNCEITGFGLDGPFSDLKAYDLIVQGESGLCEITGTEAGPARVGVSVCDIAAGMNAHAAILQALLARERSGEGCSIQISLFDSVADWMNVPLLHFRYAGTAPRRMGVNHATIAPYGAYETAEGNKIIFSVQNEREWAAFCTRFLGRTDLIADERFAHNDARVANRRALDDVITSAFSEMSEEEAMEALKAANLAYGRLNTLRQAAEHPHLRSMIQAGRNGDIQIVPPAAIVNGQAPSTCRPVPMLGQHSSSIREEFTR